MRIVFHIVRNDLRMYWRSSPARSLYNLGAALLVFSVAQVIVLAVCAARHRPPTSRFEAGTWCFIVSVMLGAALRAGSRVVHDGIDNDFLLTSPASAVELLVARLLSVTLAAFCSVGLFALPLFDGAVWMMSHRYIAAFGVWGLLAILTAALGTTLSIAAFCALGARRSRDFIALLSGVVSASVILASQIPSFVSPARQVLITAFYARFVQTTPVATISAAGRGSARAIATLAVISGATALLSTLLVSNLFFRSLQTDAGEKRRRADGALRPWSEGAFRSSVRKELRLIARHPQLLSRLSPSLGVLLVPAVLLRVVFAGQLWLALSPLSLLFCGIISLRLTEIATYEEENWDLVRLSPCPNLSIQAAKMGAGMALPSIVTMGFGAVLSALGRPALAWLTLGFSLSVAMACCWLTVAGIRLRPAQASIRRGGRMAYRPNGISYAALAVVGAVLLGGTVGLACVARGKWLAVGYTSIAATLTISFATLLLVKIRAIAWDEY